VKSGVAPSRLRASLMSLTTRGSVPSRRPDSVDPQIVITRTNLLDLWVQASLNQRQRFQQMFFPDGIAFDGNWNPA
jgi:hypothetical protein